MDRRDPRHDARRLLFLTLLPSTVQSSIAFTAIARGNVAAAVVSASASNLLGIFLTPLLVALLMPMPGGGAGLISFDAVEKIMLQLLAPFIVGHLARPLIGAFVARHKAMIGRVDRASILLVVYAAFSAAVVEGLWQSVSAGEMAVLAVACSVLLLFALIVTWALGPDDRPVAGGRHRPAILRVEEKPGNRRADGGNCCSLPPWSGRSCCRSCCFIRSS